MHRPAAERRRPGSAWAAAAWVAAAALLQVPAYSPAAFGWTSAWWLQVAAAAVLAWRVGHASDYRQAAGLGWLHACVWLVAGTGWLFISMHRYGGLPAWLSGLAVLALASFLALYLALAMALFRWLRTGRAGADAALFAACWLMAEWARGTLFTGFPWVASGYAHVDSPLAPLAPWVGVYGLGALAAMLAAAFAWCGWRGRVWAGLLLVLGWAAQQVGLGPIEFTRPTGRLQVSLLQGNVPQDEKFSPERLPETLTWYGQALIHAPGELVIAPETAIPLLPAQMPDDYWETLRSRFAVGGRSALVGVPLGDEDEGYSNSVAGLSARAAAWPGGSYRYDKHHLVPFGEFIPFGFRWFVDMMNMPLGDFDRGSLVQPPFPVQRADGGVEQVAPNVCYEDLFGEELAARLVDGRPQATVFANVSNIAWFGRSLAVEQHLQISRMRTLELQRPMLRATNTGATVVIDHRGRVTHALPAHTRGVLTGEVQGRSGLTPYAHWAGRLSLWPLLLLACSLPGWRTWRRWQQQRGTHAGAAGPADPRP